MLHPHIHSHYLPLKYVFFLLSFSSCYFRVCVVYSTGFGFSNWATTKSLSSVHAGKQLSKNIVLLISHSPLYFHRLFLQLRPQPPSRHATQTLSPPRCVCSWRFVKSVRRLCRRPRPEHSSLEGYLRPTPPKAPLSINQPGRMAWRSSKETKAGAQRSRKVKDHKLEMMTNLKKERKEEERVVCHPCRMFLYVLTPAGSVLLALTSSALGQKYIWIWSQLIRLLKVHLIHLIKQKSLKNKTNHMQVLMSQVLLVVVFYLFFVNIQNILS